MHKYIFVVFTYKHSDSFLISPTRQPPRTVVVEGCLYYALLDGSLAGWLSNFLVHVLASVVLSGCLCKLFASHSFLLMFASVWRSRRADIERVERLFASFKY